MLLVTYSEYKKEPRKLTIFLSDVIIYRVIMKGGNNNEDKEAF
jgi:hypothetical protein